MLIRSCCFLFSKLHKLSVLVLRFCLKRFTSSRRMSCCIKDSSLSLTVACTVLFMIVLWSSNSSMMPFMASFSFFMLVKLRFAFLSSASCLLICSDNTLCKLFCSSRFFSSCSAFRLNSSRSSTVRSPETLATLRCMSWDWKSTAYSNSCCRCLSWSNLLIWNCRFLMADWAPLISPSVFASSARNLYNSWLSLYMVSLAAFISLSTDFSVASISCLAFSTS
mmetsp:Transcript_112939/g.326258  ORF Transcript_112939/g.326258 Transcript_112939/m.326258 type:complete len:222 (+) Transcript_112939:1018-1683(+)